MADLEQKHPAGRLGYIDALRGLAALGVLFFHLLNNTVMVGPLTEALPGQITWLQKMGANGVEVFFVLSGFVLVLSLRNTPMDGAGGKRFVVRRQVRLDPPYWIVLGLTIGSMAVETALGFTTKLSDLTPAVVVANMVYLQNILGVDEILGVAWTLCIEIQFYLLLLLLLLGVRRFTSERPSQVPLPDIGSGDTARPIVPLLLLATGVGSLVGSWYVDESFTMVWAFATWHMFSLGALLFIANQSGRSLHRTLVWVLFALECATFVLDLGYDRPSTAAAIIAFTFIYSAIKWSELGTFLTLNKTLQYFGSRSYSLYLVHLTVITVVMRAGYKATGDDGSFAIAWMLVAFVASLIAAEALYRGVERPAVLFSATVKAVGFRAALGRIRGGDSDPSPTA